VQLERRDEDDSTRTLTSTWSTAWTGRGVRIDTLRGRFRPSRWSAPEVASRWGLVLARRGAYRRRADGVEYVVDANTGFVRRPGEEWSSAPFTTAFEELTVVDFEPEALGELPVDERAGGPVNVDPPRALAHRLLVRALGGDDLDVELGIVELVHRCLPPPTPGRPSCRRSSTAAARRRLTGDSVELLHTSFHEQLGLVDLARRVGASPYHLSRVFREVTGSTISQYRTRLRVHAVLEQLDNGEHDLSTIAAAAGFADHGHMTRTITGLLGESPSALRARLGPPGDRELGRWMARPA
jgi:AraC-like DNA-binding protein